jgi:hypothetical protein
MSIRVRHQLVVVASEVPDPTNTDELMCHFRREAEAVSQVIESEFDHEESGSFQVAASGGTTTLPLGSVVTGKILYIEASGDLTVRLDAEVTGHELKAKASGVKRKMFLSSEFTSAPILVNDGTADVTGSFFIAGDV